MKLPSENVVQPLTSVIRPVKKQARLLSAMLPSLRLLTRTYIFDHFLWTLGHFSLGSMFFPINSNYVPGSVSFSVDFELIL